MAIKQNKKFITVKLLQQ